MRIYAILLLLAVLITAPRPLPASRRGTNDFVARFDRMDERINNGQGYSAALNTTGTLAWGEGYILEAYAEMYRATGDRAYLENLVEQFDRVLANRDDVRHVKGFYRPEALPGWGSDDYSKGHWHIWAVHSGMICLGPMDFVALVKAEGRLKKQFGPKANEYLARIKETVAVHAPEFRNGPGPDEGYYIDPTIGPLPANQQNSLGMVELGLYLVTRDHVYRDRVERLARYFRNRLRRASDGAYDWSYWPKPNGPGTGSEDISHAAINVEFAVRCRRARIVFTEDDMKAFARTWLAHVRRGSDEWADTVGGAGGPNTHMPQAGGRWLGLTAYDRRVFDDVRQAFANVDENQATGPNLLGLARLARWQNQLSRRGNRKEETP